MAVVRQRIKVRKIQQLHGTLAEIFWPRWSSECNYLRRNPGFETDVGQKQVKITSLWKFMRVVAIFNCIEPGGPLSGLSRQRPVNSRHGLTRAAARPSSTLNSNLNKTQ